MTRLPTRAFQVTRLDLVNTGVHPVHEDLEPRLHFVRRCSQEGWDYDVILFDSPPGSEHLERLGVVASTRALVVTNAHPIAVVGAGRVVRDLEARRAKGRRGPSEWALVTNMIDARRSLDRNIDALLGDMGHGIPNYQVRQDVNLAMATAQGILLAEYAPTCRAVEALKEIQGWCHG